ETIGASTPWAITADACRRITARPHQLLRFFARIDERAEHSGRSQIKKATYLIGIETQWSSQQNRRGEDCSLEHGFNNQRIITGMFGIYDQPVVAGEAENFCDCWVGQSQLGT